ncbi:tetratricopeptide repeat protein [Haliscomenobacter hydrossis]|uniref:Tetratricopeptide TPR_2 repeat-containing protein n=1 Tax=Haliscomenobacter hydrossis (strain ATCC 27775 / DSM 1100 / LMG 10767 / O) TaxID=760192 RepID=F4L1V4_HALH1|nr:tetratricopeptide repeat protein [Haliscomenobacter hydrossis]AEE49613.1 Tetratricopeptide TPR_2 repeat-containing protein [Haliscomenobacter hydrossis DSM 1100]
MKTLYFSKFWKWLTKNLNSAQERKLRMVFHRFFDWMIIFAKLLGLIFIIVLIRNISIEMRKDAYSIQTFHVPKNLEESGFNGLVLAQKIMDEVAAIKADAGSIKNDSVKFDAAIKPEMDLSVLGVGFSTQTILYYAKQLLGKKDRTVSGELTALANDITLTLRFSDANKIEVKNGADSLSLDKRIDLVLKAAAEKVLKWSDPYILAVYYYHQNRFDEAMECARFILRERPKEASWAYLAWGSILVRQQNQQGGIEKFEKSLELNPNLEPALVNLAWAYFRNGHFEKAILKFEKLLSVAKLGATRSTALNGLAQSNLRLKHLDKAERAFQQGIKEFPQDLYFYGNYGDFKIRYKRDTFGALELYRQARAQAPETAAGYLFQSASLFYENRRDSAVTMLYKALEYDPNNLDALRQIIQIEFRKGNFEQALRIARRLNGILAQNNAGNQDRLYNLQSNYNIMAMAHYSQLRYDSSVYYAKTAIAIDTNIAYPYTSLGEAYAFMGQKEKFYQLVAKAVQKGFEYTPETLEQEPYVRFVNDPKFQKAARYKPLKN